MNFDNTVSLYHVVAHSDTFDKAVTDVFTLLKTAEDRYPGWPRVFYLDIEEHTGDRDGFDEDFFEFQQEFWFSTIAHFVTAFDIPLAGQLINPNLQRNDLPNQLVISGPGEASDS